MVTVQGKTNEFKKLHPVVSFIYFTSVIGFSMFLIHPVMQIISLAGTFAYSVYLKGKRVIVLNLKIFIPIIALTALINPIFNQQGITILLYLPGGKPLTLESVLYGLSAGVLLATVVCWFSCSNEIMTSDKLMYIFGRVLPAISLVATMTLRFIPKFKEQLKVVTAAQRGIGHDLSGAGLVGKAKISLDIISVMMSWSLENAVETADSMRSRGYGVGKRTTFSNFIFSRRDKALMLIIMGSIGFLIYSVFGGIFSFQYYPSVSYNAFGLVSKLAITDYVLLCFMPIFIELWEGRKWKEL